MSFHGPLEMSLLSYLSLCEFYETVFEQYQAMPSNARKSVLFMSTNPLYIINIYIISIMERASFTCSVLNNTSGQELLENQSKKSNVYLFSCGFAMPVH